MPQSLKSVGWEKLSLNILTALAIVTGIALIAWSRGIFFYADANFAKFYDRVPQFGDECSYAIEAWKDGDSFEQQRTKAHELTPLKMPYRRALASEKPDVAPQQYLYTKCPVDLSSLRQTGFAWLRLHQALGDSAVYLNGTLRMVDAENGDFEFPLLPSDRIKSTLEIVSRPLAGKGGWLGLATGMPMFFTDSRAAMSLPNLLTYQDLVLKPIYWFNYALVFLMVFGAAWVAGVRYPEVGWMVVCAALDALMSFALFAPDNVFPPWLRQANAIAGMGRNLAFAAAVASFFRLRIPKVGISGLVLIAVGIFAGALQLSTPAPVQLFLYRYLPWYSNAVLFTAIFAASIHLMRKYPNLRSGRYRFMAGFAAVFALAQIVNIVAYHQIGMSLAVPIMEAGWVAFGLFLILDLSVFYRRFLEERLRRRESETKAKELSAIAMTTQMFAHDVRRPFNVLEMLLDRLSDFTAKPISPEDVARYTGALRKDIKSVNAMIADLLDFGHETKVILRPTEPAQLITAALTDILATRKTNKALSFSSDLQHTSCVLADSGRIERVIANITANAIEAIKGSEKKTGTIKISTRDTKIATSARGMVVIAIANDGPPVAREDLPQLFDSFFTRGKAGGTGLGLAISRKIVEAHGGTILCKSDVDETVFEITLPAADLESTQKTLNLAWTFTEPNRSAGALENKEAASGNPLALPLVVLVEDNLFISEAWVRYAADDVSASGHPAMQLMVFDSPESFWEAARGNEVEFIKAISCLVIDYYFDSSAQNGADLARALREKVPGNERPILILSSDTPGHSVDDAMFDAMISKHPQDVLSHRVKP